MVISDSDYTVDDHQVVEGRFFDCPEGLVVGADCLGQTYRTVIGDQLLAITLPSLPDMTDTKNTLPGLVGPETYYEYPPRPDTAKNINWGFITSSRGGEPQCAEINQLHYTFESTGTDGGISEACERIESGLDSWWERISMWLDTFTELDLLRHGSKSGVTYFGKRFLAYTRYGDGAVKPVNWMSTSIISPPQAIKIPDHANLMQCFNLAGSGAVLPTEWQYLREARSWLNAGKTRRAVIDACTAAEIALANQVHHLLGTTNEVVVEQLLLRCNGIADVARLVRKIGGKDATASQKEVGEGLARVRNRAAHAGLEPDYREARRAVEIATSVVTSFLPREMLNEC